MQLCKNILYSTNSHYAIGILKKKFNIGSYGKLRGGGQNLLSTYCMCVCMYPHVTQINKHILIYWYSFTCKYKCNISA